MVSVGKFGQVLATIIIMLSTLILLCTLVSVVTLNINGPIKRRSFIAASVAASTTVPFATLATQLTDRWVFHPVFFISAIQSNSTLIIMRLNLTRHNYHPFIALMLYLQILISPVTL